MQRRVPLARVSPKTPPALGRGRPRCRLRRVRPAASGAAALAVTTLLGMAPASASPPSPGDVQRQQQAAQRLRGQAQAEAARLAVAQRGLAAVAAAANRALDEYQQARQRADAAAQLVLLEQERVEMARWQVAEARAQINRYAGAAYQTGVSGGTLSAVGALLSADTAAELGRRLDYVGFVADRQNHVLTTLRRAEEAQRRALANARRAAELRRQAQQAAAQAKQRADTLVDQQRRLVQAMTTRLSRTRAAAAEAQRQAAALARARRIALERERQSQRERRRTAFPAGVGTCTGGSLAGYSNGRLPPSALCPLWGAPGHLLRADAAAAFSRMSLAYAAQFGAPICVTDSYRPYAVQVRLYREKPQFAAYPGTSEHGWGRAVDLCGGIQIAGMVQHVWMLMNATRFGWFHPSWASPTGSRPEPWHFEYGGG